MGSPPLLQMHAITKRFAATVALRGVSLEVHRGRVLALVGENGAGKSTLMKVLSGAVRPDAGTMTLDGVSYAPPGPHAARLAGVAMIYQELNLAPDLNVEDNIMLGQEIHRGGWLSRGRQRRRVREVLELLGHPELNPASRVADLSIGAQQLVEIARGLVSRARVMVFDEPTSSLPQSDVQRLFEVVRTLQTQGLGIIYISHFLEEVRQVADDFHVLRDGESVASGQLAQVTDRELVTQMVGRDVTELFPQVPHEPGEILLEVCRVSGDELPRDVSLDVRRGEILGIAGLVGAGRTEWMRCLYGLDPLRSGSIAWNGRILRKRPRPRRSIRTGLGMVSEDRKREGLAQEMSVLDNVTLSRLGPYQLAGVLLPGRRGAATAEWLGAMQVKTAGAGVRIATLSGGNQQKVALARILHQQADLLLLDEPTRGIDVGTKAEIYRWIGRLAAEGKSIVFVSSYLPELLAVCDRLAVFSRGRLQALRPTSAWTEESVLEAAMAAPNADHENA